MKPGSSFRERYRRAVGDAQLRRNLLAFQRGWRASRDDRFAEYTGPEGGSGGGTIVAEGTPETVAAAEESHTGMFLKRMLR